MYINHVERNTSHHMATRSRIGIELKDGSILSAYHHWDGSIRSGWVVFSPTTITLAELIDGGDMSLCWTNERWS